MKVFNNRVLAATLPWRAGDRRCAAKPLLATRKRFTANGRESGRYRALPICSLPNVAYLLLHRAVTFRVRPLCRPKEPATWLRKWDRQGSQTPSDGICRQSLDIVEPYGRHEQIDLSPPPQAPFRREFNSS